MTIAMATNLEDKSAHVSAVNTHDSARLSYHGESLNYWYPHV